MCHPLYILVLLFFYFHVVLHSLSVLSHLKSDCIKGAAVTGPAD